MTFINCQDKVVHTEQIIVSLENVVLALQKYTSGFSGRSLIQSNASEVKTQTEGTLGSNKYHHLYPDLEKVVLECS